MELYHVRFYSDLVAYLDTWQAMQDLVQNRYQNDCHTGEIWLLQHTPVFTLGQAGKPEHILAQNHIPIVQSDRGGQVTYHGPGQLIIYFMLPLRALKLSVKDFVSALEQGMIDFLANQNINAARRVGAPGVYVDGAKIGSLGLRVRHGWTYHGISFNVDMDLAPFKMINPCGIENLSMTQLSHFIPEAKVADVQMPLLQALLHSLGLPRYDHIQ